MTITKRYLKSILTGITILTMVGCSGGKQQTDRNQPPANAQTNTQTEQLNLYTARHYDSDQLLYDKFTEETGIKVNIIEGKDDELIERIKSEGENSPADVLVTVDVGRLWRAQQEGVFQAISSQTLDKAIPKNLRSPQGYWYAFSKRARVIIYNKDRVKLNELSTYEGLAEPKWKGRICLRSSSNIYNQSLVAAMIEKLGEEKTKKWIEGTIANLAREPQSNDVGQIKSVGSGECDVSIINHYYLARLIESDDPKDKAITSKVGVFFPNQNKDGTHVNISGAGVAIDAPEKENAIKFLNFLASSEAQAIFANNNNEYPVISGLQPNPVVAGFGKFKESTLNVAAYGEKNAQAVKLMDEAGWK